MVAVKVDPVGLPASLKAWRERDPEPVLTLRCTVDDCGTEVGAVYRSPRAVVVESRLGAPEEQAAEFTPMDLGDFIDGLGITGLLEGFDTDPAQPQELGASTVRAQIDLLHSELYWHDPQPVCPTHGELRVDRGRLADAVRDGHDSHRLSPPG